MQRVLAAIRGERGRMRLDGGQKEPQAWAGADWAAEIPTQLPNKGPFDRWLCNRDLLLSEL